MVPIPVNLIVEDQLSEAVLTKIVHFSSPSYNIGACYGKQGRSYIEKKVNNFNQAAKRTAYLVLADLNTDICPPALITHWFNAPKHHNLLFNVAVKEVESWVLADRAGLASFFGVSKQRIPIGVEKIDHSKEFLINLARRSRNRLIREDIVPRTGSTARIGPNYNARLAYFVENNWSIDAACENSESLARTVKRLREFTPVWETSKI